MIDIRLSEFRDAFWRHVSAANVPQSNDSHLLLLLYAAECGLKCVCLKALKVHTTAKLEEDQRERLFHHDLNQLLGAAKAPGALRVNSARCGTEQIATERLHEALRYGQRLEPTDRQKVEDSVRQVIEWAKEMLS